MSVSSSPSSLSDLGVHSLHSSRNSSPESSQRESPVEPFLMAGCNFGIRIQYPTQRTFPYTHFLGVVLEQGGRVIRSDFLHSSDQGKPRIIEFEMNELDDTPLKVVSLYSEFGSRSRVREVNSKEIMQPASLTVGVFMEMRSNGDLRSQIIASKR